MQSSRTEEAVFPAESFSAQLLLSLMDTVSEGVFVAEVLPQKQFRLVQVNRLLAHMLPDELQTGNLDDTLPHKTVQWLRRRMGKVLSSGHAQTFQVTTDLFHGGDHHVKVRLAPIAENGNIRFVLGTVQVLTETIKIRKEAKQHRDRFGLAMEYAPFGLCFVAETMKPMLVNRTLSFWLDKPHSLLMQQDVSNFIHADDRAMFAQALRKVMQGGRVYRAIEVRLQPSEQAGEYLWVSVNMSRVVEDGSAYGMVQLTDITARKQHEDELVRLATRDHLTGLANRKVFEDELRLALKNARRYSRKGAVLYIDLNNFKYVNDNFGHKAGDAILQQAGRVLQALLRETDVIARIGGDEFAVIMAEMSETLARRKARQIENAIAHASAMAHGKEVRVGASVGVHMFDGSQMGMTMDEVIAAADHDMYANKAASKQRLVRVVS